MFQVFHQKKLSFSKSPQVVEPDNLLSIIKAEPPTVTKKKRGRPSLKKSSAKASISKENAPDIKLSQSISSEEAKATSENLSEDAKKDSKIKESGSKINGKRKRKSFEIISTGNSDESSQKMSSLMNNERSKKKRLVAVNKLFVQADPKNVEINHFDPMG